jgi:hypothetical protein
MRLITVAIAAAAIAGFAGAASAGKQQGFKGAGGGCILIEGGEQITVGEMMQTLRTRKDGVSGNPKQIVDAYSGSGWGNVGGLIADKCGDPS